MTLCQVQYIPRMAHTAQENTLLAFTGLLRRLQLGNGRMEEAHRAGWGGEGCRASMPSLDVPPSQNLGVQPGSSPNHCR